MWHCRGAGPGCNNNEIANQLNVLRSQISLLEEQEKELDQQQTWVHQSIRNVTDDVDNNRYPSEINWS